MSKELTIRSANGVSDFIAEQPGGRSTATIARIALGGIFVLASGSDAAFSRIQ